MDRSEAISLIDELLKNCPKLDDVFLCLVPPKLADFGSITQGYQVHMRISMDEETEACVQGIIDFRGLVFEKDVSRELVVIYKKHDSMT